MTWRLLWATAAVAIAATLPADAAGCPCKYKAPGLKNVSSAQPIPNAHQRCLVPIDGYIGWLKKNVARANTGPINTVDMTLRMYSRLDWGVPPMDSARNMLQRADQNLPKYRQKLEDAQAEAEQDKKRTGVQTRDIRRLSDYSDNLQKSLIVTSEQQVKEAEASKAYAECVIANDLPPTETPVR